MNAFSEFWNGLGRSARRGLVAGVVLIALATVASAAFLLREPYGVLFSGLSQNDLASMAAELDRMKVPYRVGDDGALLVPEAVVGKTRLALVNRDVPLHGAVGFEVFNNEEFGTSDFVQKINYQRALQGELTRTILSIDEVESARVHLALPEQGLFRKEQERAKASVTVVTKPGRTLQPPQVVGIQRLVAASVPEVLAQDVTVLDQHGVPLSRQAADGADALAGAGAAGLDLKSSTERYLTQKAEAVLDRSFGKGQVVVSVDAVFVEQQTRVTTEEVLPARGAAADAVPTGVVVRERQNSRDGDGATPAGSPQVTTSETEYQVGHRTEQVTSPAGALKRLEVAAVVRRAMSDADLDRVREIVSASIGLNRERGDVVTVQAIAPPADAASATQASPVAVGTAAPVAAKPRAADARPSVTWAVLALASVLAGLAIVLLVSRRVRGHATAGARPLSGAEREQLLLSLQAWLAEPDSARAPGAPR
jgi:flagellar M-ring protein FliF